MDTENSEAGYSVIKVTGGNSNGEEWNIQGKKINAENGGTIFREEINCFSRVSLPFDRTCFLHACIPVLVDLILVIKNRKKKQTLVGYSLETMMSWTNYLVNKIWYFCLRSWHNNSISSSD